MLLRGSPLSVFARRFPPPRARGRPIVRAEPARHGRLPCCGYPLVGSVIPRGTEVTAALFNGAGGRSITGFGPFAVHAS